MAFSSIPMSGHARAHRARHCLLPQLHHRSAFLKTSQPALTRTIKGIENVMGLHRGRKTLPVIGPTLSDNQGAITLKEREPTPASVGISTPIHAVWSTGLD
jgi:hypothetical protein